MSSQLSNQIDAYTGSGLLCQVRSSSSHSEEQNVVAVEDKELIFNSGEQTKLIQLVDFTESRVINLLQQSQVYQEIMENSRISGESMNLQHSIFQQFTHILNQSLKIIGKLHKYTLFEILQSVQSSIIHDFPQSTQNKKVLPQRIIESLPQDDITSRNFVDNKSMNVVNEFETYSLEQLSHLRDDQSRTREIKAELIKQVVLGFLYYEQLFKSFLIKEFERNLENEPKVLVTDNFLNQKRNSGSQNGKSQWFNFQKMIDQNQRKFRMEACENDSVNFLHLSSLLLNSYLLSLLAINSSQSKNLAAKYNRAYLSDKWINCCSNKKMHKRFFAKFKKAILEVSQATQDESVIPQQDTIQDFVHVRSLINKVEPQALMETLDYVLQQNKAKASIFKVIDCFLDNLQNDFANSKSEIKIINKTKDQCKDICCDLADLPLNLNSPETNEVEIKIDNQEIVNSLILDLVIKVESMEEEKIKDSDLEIEKIEQILYNHDLKDDDEEKDQEINIEEISGISQSTEDIQENFSSKNVQNDLSRQVSINTEIDEMHKNLYSSDVGESVSIKQQKYSSDFKEADQNLSNSKDAQYYNSQRQVQFKRKIPMEEKQEVQPNFEIIRSKPNFVPDTRQNNNKKKKKKRTKIGYQGTIQQDFHQQSNKLNEFMKSKLIDASHEDEDSVSRLQSVKNIQPNNKSQSVVLQPKNKKPQNEQTDPQIVYIKKGQSQNQSIPNEESKEIVSYDGNHNEDESIKLPNMRKKKSQNSKGKKSYGSQNQKNRKAKNNDQSNRNKNNTYVEDEGFQNGYYPGYNLYYGDYYDTNGLAIQELNYETIKMILSQANLQTQLSQQPEIVQSQEFQETICDEDQESYLSPEEELTEQFFKMVRQQMKEFDKHLEKKLDSVRKERERVISIINSIVKDLYNHQYQNYVSTKMYGSMASSLAIDSSDVDLAVVGLDFKGNRDSQVKEMRRLAEHLKHFMKCIHSINFIETASIPVIKLQIDLLKVSKHIQKQEMQDYGFYSVNHEIDESMRFLGIDITFEEQVRQFNYYSDTYSRMSSGVQCIQLIKALSKEYYDLKPIVLILKKLLQNYNLNHTYEGGLNSYSLVLMTTAYLSLFPMVESMSKNLMEFLNFYGNYFNPRTSYIEQIQIKSSAYHLDQMTIIDPLNPQNNTTKGAYRMADIQQIFRHSYQILSESLNQYKQCPQDMQVIEKLLSRTDALSFY